MAPIGPSSCPSTTAWLFVTPRFTFAARRARTARAPSS
jgi:hypothetical protein